MPSKPPAHRPRGWKPPAIRKAEADEQRGSAASRGYGHRWRVYRLAFLAAHPLCVRCMDNGLTVLATVVNHIRDHLGDQTLFWDPANHEALCKPCHDAHTARTRGWGRNPGAGQNSAP